MPATWVVRDIEAVHRKAWPLVLWGAAVVLLGVAALSWPGLTAEVLIRMAGLVILGVGLLLSYGAWRLRDPAGRLWLAALVPALSVVAAGVVVLFLPSAVASLVLAVIGVFALLAGIWDLVTGIAVLVAAKWGWLRVARGALLTAFGSWVLLTPRPGLEAAGWVFGLFAILLGALSVALGTWVLRA